eukprot:2144693-Rhodomonas_salina.6
MRCLLLPARARPCLVLTLRAVLPGLGYLRTRDSFPRLWRSCLQPGVSTRVFLSLFLVSFSALCSSSSRPFLPLPPVSRFAGVCSPLLFSSTAYLRRILSRTDGLRTDGHSTHTQVCNPAQQATLDLCDRSVTLKEPLSRQVISLVTLPTTHHKKMAEPNPQQKLPLVKAKTKF